MSKDLSNVSSTDKNDLTSIEKELSYLFFNLNSNLNGLCNGYREDLLSHLSECISLSHKFEKCAGKSILKYTLIDNHF